MTATSLVDQQVPVSPVELLPRAPTMPGHVRAVAVVVLARALAVDGVVAVGVVHVAVLVVVLAVARLVLGLVDVCLEIGMVGVDAGVQDRHLGAARARAPGRRRVDVVVLGAVDQRPLQRVEGIVGGGRGELREVGLGVGHVRMAREALAQRIGGLARARLHEGEPAAANGAEAPRGAALERAQDLVLALLGHALLEAHQQLARSRRRRRGGGSGENGQQGGEHDQEASHRASLAPRDGCGTRGGTPGFPLGVSAQ